MGRSAGSCKRLLSQKASDFAGARAHRYCKADSLLKNSVGMLEIEVNDRELSTKNRGETHSARGETAMLRLLLHCFASFFEGRAHVAGRAHIKSNALIRPTSVGMLTSGLSNR